MVSWLNRGAGVRARSETAEPGILRGEIIHERPKAVYRGAVTAGQDQRGFAIFLNGPIGVGKTSLGRALARNLGSAFIDGDDHATPGKPWYGSSLSTSRSLPQPRHER